MRILCSLHSLTTGTLLLSTLLTPPTTAIPAHALTTTTTPPPLPLLQKRRPPLSLQNLYLEKTIHLTTLLPTTAAASLLADFYAEIHVRCVTYWIPSLPPPQAHLVVRWGPFQLSFVANDGATQGISWEFVRDFSALMERVTRRGYTGVYDSGWWDVAGMLGIYVGLRVVGMEMGGGGGEAVGSS